ncbi:MAG TPA: family 1 glycosylhydrolase [Gemmatimonadaceae bacterium]|nr:family 1 glycosylhydrolase [Gemmatimonadaceae bacterium]
MPQSPFLFAAGVDNSCPTLASGRRIDEMDRSGHYARWEGDFAHAHALGVRAMRYGPAYYRVHVAPDRLDWDVCDEPLRKLRDLRITIIADLCHFGVPSWLGGFQDDAFPVLFAQYARAFARRYTWIRHFTPIYEIFTTASQSALLGRWNECLRSEAAFVRAMRNLCMAHELAIEAIESERPDAIIVQHESLTHIHPAGRDASVDAARWNSFKRLALDLTLGAELEPGMATWLNGHGVTSNDLTFFRERRARRRRWIGTRYDPRCERRLASTGRVTLARRGHGLHKLAASLHHRYGVPLCYGASYEGPERAVRWLGSQWDDVLSLRRVGIPVTGFTWHALVDRTTWRGTAASGDSVHSIGLLDLQRRVRGVGTAFSALAAQWSRRMADRPIMSGARGQASA